MRLWEEETTASSAKRLKPEHKLCEEHFKQTYRTFLVPDFRPVTFYDLKKPYKFYTSTYNGGKYFKHSGKYFS